ncbi:MAG: phosphoribosylaminoimidazolesuccinocarboxamide synthase, partial [Candidatus Krumholzibacteria bacterium]|nr:phosphoribosylaminoimidazolesuccinocarboxamide synthase [Candidatus Krumholzibacteria bacterium]
RGYLTGSGLKDYQATGGVCGIPLPDGMQDADRLSKPIFTPAFKADEGHDRNVDHAEGREIVGEEWFDTLEETSMEIYRIGEEYARERGIIIADTKFEFGVKDGKLLLIDEVLTPDSSRFWAMEDYQPGSSPPSYDKQVLRNWLEKTGWDKNSTPPALDEEIVREVYGRYRDIHERLFPKEGAEREGQSS